MKMTQDKVFLMRQSIVKLTQLLTKSGIEVTQRGISAYVKSDPKTGKPVQVNLPYLPDNAPQELIDAIQGFLDHEVAHVLFSDFGALKKISTRTEHAFTNVLEDARIEKAMAQRFQGSASNLAVTGEFVLNTVIRPKLAELDAAGASEAEYTNVLLMPSLRAAAGQYSFAEFMDKNGLWAKIPQLTEAIAKFQPDIDAMTSTHDAVVAAKAIVKKMRSEEPAPASKPEPTPPTPPAPPAEDEEEEPAPPTPAPPAKDEEEEEEPAPPAPKDEEEEEPAPPTPPGPKDEEEEPAAPEDEPEDDAPHAGESDDGEPVTAAPDDDATGEAADHDDEAGGVSDQGVEDPDLEDGTGESATSDALSSIDEDGANDYDDTLSREISKTAADSAKSADYIVYTTDKDRIETLKLGSGFNSDMLKHLEDKVAGMAGPMQKDLERAIIARSRVQWEGGRRSGRINAASLSRLAVGDDRVFRKRQESTSKDVAVSLVIDASGSMSGSKIHTAAASAFALSQVLDRLKISHEVICFTTGAMDGKISSAATDEARKLGITYSRMEPLYMPVVKHYGERLSTDVKSRFAWLPNGRFLANNVDGESVLIAAQRLAMRKESGKAMIVLSDGSPACNGDSRAVSKHLRETVKMIEKSGVNIIGIGVESSEVTRYYSKNIVINRVEELPTRVIGELRKLLLA